METRSARPPLPALTGLRAVAALRTAALARLMRRPRPDPVGIALALAAWLAYSRIVLLPFGTYDLGITAYWGVRVRDGALPYVDLYTLFGPLPLYVHAALFALCGATGRTLVAEYTASAALVVLASYWCLRATLPRRVAGPCAALVAGLVPILDPYHFIAVAGLIGTLGGLVRHGRDRRRRWLFVAGGCAGLAGAWRWDYGAYALLLAAVALLALPALWRRGGGRAWRARLGHAALVAATAALVGLPAYLPALLADPRAVLRVPRLARATLPYRALPWPAPPLTRTAAEALTTGLTNVVACVALGFLVWAGVLWCAALLASRRPRVAYATALHAALATQLAVCLVYQSIHRPTMWQLTPGIVATVLAVPPLVALVTASAGASCPAPTGRLLRAGIRAGGLLVATGALLLGASVLPLRQRAAPGFALPALSGFAPYVDTDPEYEALLRYIRANTAPGEPIYSGTSRHDRAYLNDMMIYFAAERPAAVRDAVVEPGYTTRRDVQLRMVADLERTRPRLIVLLRDPASREPNRSRESSGVADLDDYIRAHYRPVAVFGPYTVLLPYVALPDS